MNLLIILQTGENSKNNSFNFAYTLFNYFL